MKVELKTKIKAIPGITHSVLEQVQTISRIVKIRQIKRPIEHGSLKKDPQYYLE
jgi:hypothetical protein